MLMGTEWRVPACGSRGQDFLRHAEKRYGTERHGQGLNMPIPLRSSCEVAGKILEGGVRQRRTLFCNVCNFGQTDEFAIC